MFDCKRAGGGSQSELRPTQGRAGGRRPAEERAQASTTGEQVGGKRLTGAASREAAVGRQTSTGWLTQRVGGGEDRTARFGTQVCIDIDFPSPTPPKTERTGESWNCRTMHRKEAIKTVYREVGGECKDGSTIGIDMNSHNTSVKECLSKTEVVTTDSCPDRVIIPDPTPKRVNSVFYDILLKLMPILQKDNVQDFLRFFHRNMDVMVENTCMHKYLDDNLFPDELNPDYSKADTNDIYKLIHLLCLPEMKIFMDTTRLLAKHTNDLVGEICNYIKHGKLLQTAVLLLAAQEHIRGSKRNGNSKEDGFGDIIKYISEHTSSIKLDVGIKNQAQLKEKYISSTLWLVQAISRAGKALGQCIQRHSKSPQVPRKEVLEHVSSILKFYNFCPTGEGISIESLNLSRYDCPLPSGLILDEFGTTVATHLHAGKEKALVKRLDLQYKRRSFFPCW